MTTCEVNFHADARTDSVDRPVIYTLLACDLYNLYFDARYGIGKSHDSLESLYFAFSDHRAVYLSRL